MKYLPLLFLIFLCFPALSQDRIELGYQTSKRGIEWVRPGIPTHVPTWRVSRDTNAIIWHDKSTGMRYDFSYLTETWFARGTFSSTLPPLPTQTSGSATIDNRTGFWLNASNVLHRYDKTQTAWVPFKMSYQSAAPTNVSSGVSNGAAIYTTSLWQDSDDGAVYYWDGSAWQPITTAVTNLTYTGTSSPLTLNSSTGADVTHTAGTGISLAGSTSNMTITNTLPDVTVSLTGAGINNVTGTYPNFTITGTEVDGSVTNEIQTISASGAGPSSYDIGLNLSGGAVTLSEGANIDLTRSGNTVTITNTGAAALSGVVNQVPYFNTTSTITTEAGTGSNSIAWDDVNNRLLIGTTSGTSPLYIVSPSNSGIPIASFFANNLTQGVNIAYDNINVSGTNTDIDYSLLAKGNGYIWLGQNTSTTGVRVGASDATNTIWFGARNAGITANSGQHIFVGQVSSSTLGIYVNTTSGFTGILNNNPQRTLHVTGEARITDVITDPPTTLIGVDADGDVGSFALSGLSISAGTLTATDASTTNELQTISVSANTTTLSNSGGSMTIAGAGINTVGTAGSTITITGTEVDGSVSNEGSLTVGAGSGTTSIINSNTSGSTGVTLTAGSGLTISETGNVITLANSAPDQTVSITGAGINVVTGTYPNFTVTGTEVDGSVTNEAQTLSTSGTTSGILNLSTAGGAGGGSATIAAGTGITVGQSGGTITITNSSPATAGWLLDGNTIGAAKRIGSNDNFDVVVETNNTDRIFIDNAGTVSIGGTQLTTAALNINGLQTGTGMLIAGGGALTGPNFYTATGSGTGSTATILSGVVSMISGNVEALLKNTATTGTGGGSVITLNVSPTATSNDPFIKWQTEATTDWSMGIDNDDVDDLKLHRFSRPSDNNGQGTIEFGYRTNDIGIAVNKTGIGTGTNGFYAFDAYGKIRTDQYVNNALDISNSAFATIALGTAAGTSPTVDNTITSVWGNGAHLKFTSGSSPTANGVICTVTLGAAYTFGDCVSNISARTTNASGFGYSSTFNSATRVITFTLNGTLTASTVYEFNLMFFGRN